ncbi:unnamed protein product [Prorocentrum cordatum]|uniref:Mei2-like C-terminal RNA recognition motif domain-containing protein n=1 Tax=Prorocentrum cordatum TaxID=2364126 RepID=A0ABN9TKK5_9DINO|nr:unnamed protein product [Polarella glacialis]
MMDPPITTLMLRNVPRSYSQEQLLTEIQDALGSVADFNLLFLPWDSRNNCNVGYAFLNLCDAEGAERCRGVLSEYNFRRSFKPKQCSVFPAHIQGLESNLIHLVEMSLGKTATGGEPDKGMPVVIWQGQTLRFPQFAAALHQLTDAPVGLRLPGQPCGSASPLFWSDTALPQERAPGLEAVTTRRPPTSTNGTTAPRPRVQAPSLGKGSAEAATGLSKHVTKASLPGRCGSSGSRAPEGDVGKDDDFSLLLAAVALAKRVATAMGERQRLSLQDRRAAVRIRRPPSPPPPTWAFLDMLKPPPGLELPPGLQLDAPPELAARPAAPARQPAPAGPEVCGTPALARGFAAPPAPAREAAGGVVGGVASEGRARPPTAAARGPRVLELGEDLHARVFEKFFEKCSSDPGVAFRPRWQLGFQGPLRRQPRLH